MNLAQNTSYWVVLGVIGGGGFEWAHAEGSGSTGTGDFGSYAFSLDAGQSWENFAESDPFKMEIEVADNGTPVPEPSSLLLLLAGLGGALARRKFC